MKLFIKQLLKTVGSLLKLCIRIGTLGKGYKYSTSRTDHKCIILANGPSLNDSIGRLKMDSSNDYFAVNFFALSEYFFRLKPRYYVFADEAFWIPEDRMHVQTVFQRRRLIEQFHRVDWQIKIFIPHKGFKSLVLKELLENKCIEIVSYNTGTFEGFKSLKYSLYKSNICMPTTQNVLIPSIYLAINSGYKSIELYGADFSWTKSICVNRDNVLCQIDDHFYDDGTSKVSPVLGYVDRPYRIHNYLQDLSYMFYGCWQVKEYADVCKVKILNHNTNSYIDAFDKE